MRRVAWCTFLAGLGACAAAHADDLQLGNDGAYSRTYATGRDASYHAAISALGDLGFTLEYTNPMSGSLRAHSRPKGLARELFYRIAEVRLENAPGGTRVRLVLIKTRQPEGSTRRPVRDLPVRERKEYVAFFAAFDKRLRPGGSRPG